MAKAAVSVTRCGDYERARVEEAVRQALGLLPLADGLPGAGKRVLLKPNLLSSNDPPERAVNTHPEFVRAATIFFLERGCEVLIGDSCGSLAPGSHERAVKATGLDAITREFGIEIMNFDKPPFVELDVPDGKLLPRVRAPAIVKETDCFVTLPKFKTHGLTLLTGALKNQYGLLPGRWKKDTHLAAPKPALLAQAVVDINSVAGPDLALMDAIVGMEGNGPSAGKVRRVGLVLASKDPVALDAAAGALMGYKPDDIDTTRFAQERGLGVGDLGEIEIRGVPLAEATMEDFRKPPLYVAGALMGLIPTPLLRWFINAVAAAHAVVDEERCVLCGECVTNCPAGAMSIVGKRVEVDRRRCICCYCCAEVCQHQAIRMQRPWAGRVMRGALHVLRPRRQA